MATDPKDAMQMISALNQDEATKEELAAADYLRLLPSGNGKVGSLGWCFGGGQSLNLALNDPKLSVAVIYYGTPVMDLERLAKIKAPILGIFGEADQSIPIAKVHEFDTALGEVKLPHEIHTYPGAGHAFANPSRGEGYKPQAAADAWKHTLRWLKSHLRP